MEINLLKIRSSINKAYLKVKPTRTQIETFKKNIVNLFSQIKESESEEFHKNIISEFLKNTYYTPNHYINTKGRSDLVIHNGKDSNSSVGVLFEVKKPSNRSEIPTSENINCKAFHELILYYLRERITNKNLEIKHLVITNTFEWFIFNSNDFEKLFAEDKVFVKQFIDFEEGRLSGANTDFFYKNIAESFIKSLQSCILVTHFDIREFELIIENADKGDDNRLIALYKILSPEHLLKLPFANDSNNLDKAFYKELLHIIGLEETKEGNRKIIGRRIENKRNSGSLIENSITILKYEDCLSQVPKLSDYGNSNEEQLFNISLELVITWINRILFLKLLEGQLIKYNGGDKEFRFLNVEKIHDYDELNKLFFQVLAVKESDRGELIKLKFSKIPYLNSSLFEPVDLEHKTIRINSLDNHTKIPVQGGTILKDRTGKKITGDIDPLQYLFEFLDSYDFSSEGSEDIQEENKTLINASVLGLIFEKINGYKDGSFFTPGFITMYMCHETVRRAVVQKFNEAKGWKCDTLSDIYNKIEDIKDANSIVNSIRICDPAVGSGHFLVSALNEIIAIKSELRILTDIEGKKLKEYSVEVINDELIITDEQSKLFEYNPKSRESQRVQEALFQEKQRLIENCLFGVDINPNSVKICRLRLWVELLKNAYYKPDSGYRELETLPNIDINIKCGNSLISRYSIDADIKTALKSSKWNIDNYREAIMTYRNAQNKDEKRSMEQLINKIKNDFESEVSKNDKRFLRLNKLNGELLNITSQSSLFEMTKTQKDEWNKKITKLTEEIKKFEKEIDDIKSNKIFVNAFEWRFEFPEVLNNDGDFVGFDVVIGNPPYLTGSAFKEFHSYFHENYKVSEYQLELYTFFIELSERILRNGSCFALITPNSWLKNLRMSKTRRLVLDKLSVQSICSNIAKAFEEAQVDTLIFTALKGSMEGQIKTYTIDNGNNFTLKNTISQSLFLENKDYIFDVEVDSEIRNIISKIRSNCTVLGEVFDITRGVNPYDKYRGQSQDIISSKAYHADFKKDETFLPELRGRHVNTFVYKWDNKHYISYGNWLAAPRDPKFFTGRRILFREILGKRFICTIISEDFIIDRSLYIAKPKTNDLNLETILGILVSKLMIWLFRNEKNEFDDLFPKIRLEEFKNLPIPENLSSDEKLSVIVKQILEHKRQSPELDTSDLELIIDNLVYNLFDLTDEEIRIVESS